MSALDVNVICPGVQTELDAMFRDDNPEMMQEDNGTILAVTSPENTAGVTVESLVSAGGAITNQVSVIVTQRQYDTTPWEDVVPKCPPENADEPQPTLAQTYTLDDGISRRFVMDKEAWRKMCKGDNPSAQLAKYINQYMNNAVQYMNEKLIANISANFGNYYGGVNSGTTPTSLGLIAATTPTSLNPEGFFDMVNIMEDIGAIRFMAIGAGDLRKAIQFQGIGCCNNGGADISQLENLMYYKDRYAQTTLTGERFLALKPGSVILPNVPMNVGEYENLKNPNNVKISYQHPRTGLWFDFHIKEDVDCNDVYVWISKRYTTIYPLTGAFSVGDPMYNVNGVILLNAA